MLKGRTGMEWVSQVKGEHKRKQREARERKGKYIYFIDERLEG